MDTAALDLEHQPELTGVWDPDLGEHTYDFYRCQRCQRLITQPQLKRALTHTSVDGLRICPCGALKFSPTNPIWYEFLLPRAIAFAWARIRARVFA